MAFDAMQYGARPDGTTMNTAALQECLDACAKAGGGTVRLRPGVFLTGPIRLGSNTTLHLEAGATLMGSPRKEDYRCVRLRYSGAEALTLEALVSATEAVNVAIVGRGMINGQGGGWWQDIRRTLSLPKDRRPTPKAPPGTEDYVRETPWARPRLVEFVRCRNVLFEGLTLCNSPFWTLHPLFCEGVRIHGLTVLAPEESNNTDGINPDSCRDVRISDCLIDVGDDCLALKSGLDDAARERGAPCENVVITNCIMRRGHGGVTVGSDMSGGVRNVTVSNCVFQGTDIGIRLKTMRGRGGIVEQMACTNIVMDRVPCPVHVDMHYWKKTEAGPVTERTPRFRDLRISHVRATGAEQAGFIHGLEEMPVGDVTLDDVHITAARPFRARHVRGLALRHTRVDVPQGEAFEFEDVSRAEG